MLTRLVIQNFKGFAYVDIELGQRVVFIGPNNSGKTSALQAIALWDVGVKKWLEKRGSHSRSKTQRERTGVTINRQDLLSIPVPSAKLLWRDLHVKESFDSGSKRQTQNIRIYIQLEGVHQGDKWKLKMEFDYANEESLYCRPSKESGEEVEVPKHLRELTVAYLPPMSGLAAREDRLEMGSIRVRLGEGRTAEVLRNLCWQVFEKDRNKWKDIKATLTNLFGSKLEDPIYVAERGEVILHYRNREGTKLDISSTGRGEQQTLLLLSFMSLHERAVLLLDEPDAHLEILRQRQIYDILSQHAEKTNTQIIAASHSEVMLNEAARKDVVIAFVGKPHRIDDRGSQVAKALRDIGFEEYYLAEERGWVLYLEGSTDLAILQALAEKRKHPAREVLKSPFVHYVANQPNKVYEHFYALREAKPDLVGIAIYDRLDKEPTSKEGLRQFMWKLREIENYLCKREVLIRYAKNRCEKNYGEDSLFSSEWVKYMEEAIIKTEQALKILGKDPCSPDIKASEEFLLPLFRQFYDRLAMYNEMDKSNLHLLAQFLEPEEFHPNILEALDLIYEVSQKAQPVG
ncbi:MAG: AAA family ATPase [Bacteroidia bacterium]|nr:AAA family ATPase [Bacteroidia bacterium]MDW8015454.1 AAA family ATPase [Bacteroidia bacterium]